MAVSAYIKKLQSYEEYSFSLDEALAQVPRDETAVKREIARLVAKGEIINLRKGFYLIIPPRYAIAKKLPLPLYVNKLFKYLNRKYYVGLFSAAKMHGASHQQIQRDYIITETPKLISIKKKNIDILFFTTGNWPQQNIVLKKSDAGQYQVSSPALTFVDLIHHHSKTGGLNRTLATLEELTEEITENDLIQLLQWYTNKSALQRAGFLFEQFPKGEMLADIIYNELKKTPYYPVLLSPRKNEKAGSARNRWKVDINQKLESDL
ncbi:MAG: hypothetical protein EA392_09885 [Cryomorphaceae bacterium]|nr:MAG: hypothetical protein EA392_09885 [Cryomorphaceae bacterium]